MEKRGAYFQLKRFFQPLTTKAFSDLGFRDEKVNDYISDILSRFARTDNLYKIKNLADKRLEKVVEMLLEIEDCLDLQKDTFNPFRGKEIQQHLGDYTLFMSGIFREYIERRGFFRFYILQGAKAYREVAEFLRLLYKSDALLFRDMADKFEQYAGAMSYLKKVYFRPEAYQGSYRDIIHHLCNW
jgi:hypothetical protein